MRARLPFATIPSERGTRLFGKSKMSLAALIVHAFSGFSVYADMMAARILVATFAGVTIIVAALAFLIWQRLFTDTAILGWTSSMVACLIVIMLQILTTAVLLLFIILSKRTQPPLFPARDFDKFILDVTQPYPAESNAGGGGHPGLPRRSTGSGR